MRVSNRRQRGRIARPSWTHMDITEYSGIPMPTLTYREDVSHKRVVVPSGLR